MFPCQYKYFRYRPLWYSSIFKKRTTLTNQVTRVKPGCSWCMENVFILLVILLGFVSVMFFKDPGSVTLAMPIGLWHLLSFVKTLKIWGNGDQRHTIHVAANFCQQVDWLYADFHVINFYQGHPSDIPLSELVLIELPSTTSPAWALVSLEKMRWVNYKSARRRRGPVVILHFSLSLWDNELRFKSNEPDTTGVTVLVEAEELQGYNFLNPHLFYVRTWLTLEVDTSMEAERHLNGTLAIYHTSLQLN